MATTASFKRSPLRNHPRILWARVRQCWPLAIWLLAAAAVTGLYSRHARFGGMTGVLDTVAEPVAPLETARLVSLAVEPGQTVRAGQLLATMDTSLVDAALAIDEARLLEAEGAIAGYQQSILQLLHDFDDAVSDAEEGLAAAKLRQQDMLQLMRQFDTAVRNAETDLAETAMCERRDSARLTELEAEQGRRKELLAKQLIDEQTARELRPEIAALRPTVAAYPQLKCLKERQLTASRAQRDEVKASIDSYPNLLQAHEKRLAEAIEERAEARRWLRLGDGEDASDAIRQKMATRTAILKANQTRLTLKRDTYVLRATRDGVVSRIFHEAGEVVNGGEPILRLVGQRSNRVIGFLPEIHLTDLSEGQVVSVWRGSGRGVRVAAVVTSIAPEVQSLPGRISPIRGQPLRGRRVTMTLADAHEFVPGETVQIRSNSSAQLRVVELVARLFDSGRQEKRQAQCVAVPTTSE